MTSREWLIALVYIDANVAKNLLRTVDIPRDESLSIAYLAAALRPLGYPVKLLQFFEMEDCFDEIMASRPRVVGFQTYPATWYKVRELCQRIKRADPTIHITLGGYLATFRGEKLMEQEPAVDTIVCGEGEQTIVELLEVLSTHQDLSRVLGIIYRQADRIQCNPYRPAVHDLDQIPFPARDILAEEITKGKHFLSPTISTSRGCTMRCSFCSAGALESIHEEKLRWRGRSPGNIVDEIEGLLRQFPQVHTIHFFDRSFEDPDARKKTRLRMIVDEILNRQVKASFSCLMRTESWQEQDWDLILRMKKAGFDCVYLGFEAASQHGLQVYHKNATIVDNKRAYELFKKAGLTIRFGFIMFNPYSTLDDLRLNEDFLSYMGVNHNFYVTASDLEIYSETPILSRVKQDGLLVNDDPPNGSYKYTFVDPAIGHIHAVMAELGQREVIRNYQDALIRTEEGLPRLRNRSVVPDGVQIEQEIAAFEHNFAQICQKTGGKFRALFIELLDLGAHRWDQKQAEEIARQAEQLFSEAYQALRVGRTQLHLKARRKGLNLVW